MKAKAPKNETEDRGQSDSPVKTFNAITTVNNSYMQLQESVTKTTV